MGTLLYGKRVETRVRHQCPGIKLSYADITEGEESKMVPFRNEIWT